MQQFIFSFTVCSFVHCLQAGLHIDIWSKYKFSYLKLTRTYDINSIRILLLNHLIKFHPCLQQFSYLHKTSFSILITSFHPATSLVFALTATSIWTLRKQYSTCAEYKPVFGCKFSVTAIFVRHSILCKLTSSFCIIIVSYRFLNVLMLINIGPTSNLLNT